MAEECVRDIMLGGTAAELLVHRGKDSRGSAEAPFCRRLLGYYLSSRAAGSVGVCSSYPLLPPVRVSLKASISSQFTHVLAHEVCGGGSGSGSPLEARRSERQQRRQRDFLRQGLCWRQWCRITTWRETRRTPVATVTAYARTQRSVLCVALSVKVLLQACVSAGVYGSGYCNVIVDGDHHRIQSRLRLRAQVQELPRTLQGEPSLQRILYVWHTKPCCV